MSSVRVKVPASSANLGPGFDCLGIALKIYNIVTVTPAATSPGEEIIVTAADLFFRRAKRKPFPFDWKITGAVPRSRGLGSSVTVRLGVLHGLNTLSGSPLDAADIFALCAELEGHPDNAAPAAFGGFTIARAGSALQRYPVSSRLSFALLIPDFEIMTSDARKALPASIPFADAVASTASSAAIAGAFASGEYDKLAGCFGDRLHQPYREKLIPCLPKVIAAGEKAGAIGGWLSGSGSTIACLTLGPAEKIARAMLKASGLKNAHTLVTRADNTGVQISG